MEKNGGPNGRRAILILTDNLSISYMLPDEKVIRALNDTDAVLDAIVVGRAIRPAQANPGQVQNLDFTPADIFHLAEGDRRRGHQIRLGRYLVQRDGGTHPVALHAGLPSSRSEARDIPPHYRRSDPAGAEMVSGRGVACASGVLGEGIARSPSRDRVERREVDLS